MYCYLAMSAQNMNKRLTCFDVMKIKRICYQPECKRIGAIPFCVLRMVRAPCEMKCFVPLGCDQPTLRNSHLRYFFPSCINVLSNASSSAWCSSSSLSLPAHIPRTLTLTHSPSTYQPQTYTLHAPSISRAWADLHRPTE